VAKREGRVEQATRTLVPFTALRKFALDNSDFRSHEEQQKAIESYLAWRNGRREIAIESWRSHIRKNRKQQASLAAAL